jgi:hypothetical protein
MGYGFGKHCVELESKNPSLSLFGNQRNRLAFGSFLAKGRVSLLEVIEGR